MALKEFTGHGTVNQVDTWRAEGAPAEKHPEKGYNVVPMVLWIFERKRQQDSGSVKMVNEERHLKLVDERLERRGKLMPVDACSALLGEVSTEMYSQLTQLLFEVPSLVPGCDRQATQQVLRERFSHVQGSLRTAMRRLADIFSDASKRV